MTYPLNRKYFNIALTLARPSPSGDDTIINLENNISILHALRKGKPEKDNADAKVNRPPMTLAGRGQQYAATLRFCD